MICDYVPNVCGCVKYEGWFLLFSLSLECKLTFMRKLIPKNIFKISQI